MYSAIVHTLMHRLRYFFFGYTSPYETEVRALAAELEVLDICHFGGQLHDLDALWAMDVAVSCSHTEGFSNALQECMAYHLPVVATDVDGNRELVQHNQTGKLCRVDDPHDMADRLTYMVEADGAIPSMGVNARQYAEEHWAWDVVCGQWEGLFEGLLCASPEAG